MEPNQNIKSGYIGVVVTLLAGVIAAVTSSEDGFPLTIMISSMGMLSVCTIVHASDPTFLYRNRVLMFLIMAGAAIPPPIYLGKKILYAEDWGLPYELRLFLAVSLGIVTIACALTGTLRAIQHISSVGAKMRKSGQEHSRR